MLQKAVLIFLVLILCGCSASQPVCTTLPATTTPPETQVVTEPENTATTVPETVPQFDPYQIIETMSIEELVGQLFLARYPGYAQAAADMETFHLGGYILFGKDFENETSATITDAIAAHQAAANLPLLFAVDEEGGSVARISCYPQFRSERFPSPRTLFSQGGMELLLTTEEEKCRLLSSLGINVNMAPVCDITTEPGAFMYSRSLGQDPDTTGLYVSNVTALMAQYGIGSVLKHFPGYGNNTDTHTGIAVDSRPLDVLESADLLPFRAGIAVGCDAILVSHTIVECLDPEMPASLSAPVISYLRQDMGFNGVIVTDDLIMQAITDLYGDADAAVLAVLAGCDLLCSSAYAVQYAAVLDAVNSGRISMERLQASAARILQWKYELGLLPVL